MPLFPSDFKKFKHVSSDDKCTILQHPAGHEIKIAHSALKGDAKKQLEALRESKAEGGVIEQASRSGLLGTQRKVIQQDQDEKSTRHAPVDNTKGDVRTPEQKAKAAEYDKTGILPGYAEGGQVLDEDPNAPKFINDITKIDQPEGEAPKLTRAQEIYNNLTQTPFESGTTDFRSMPSGKEPLSPGSNPKSFDPQMWQQARKVESDEMAANSAKAVAEQNRIIAENQARTDAGLPPLPIPGVPSGPQMPESDVQPAAGLAPDTSVSAQQPQGASQDASSMLSQGYANSMAGAKAEAQAQADLGQQNAQILQESRDASMALQQQYKTDYDELNNERQGLIHDVQNGQINPEKFWDNHSKLASSIGMIIAGFNPTNSPNAAMQYLDKQMEANLKAQQMNLDSKKSLLSANLQQFGNMKDAMNMTRVMQADLVTNQLQTAAAKASSPLAKAAALKAAGDIQAKYAPLFQQVAKQATMQKATQAANQDPRKIPALITALQATDPEAAKDMRQRFIPGLGLANDLEGAKGLREMQTTVKTVKSSINRLREIISTSGKSMSPDARAEADTLRGLLIGRLRVPITGPGAMSEGERQLLEKMIPDATGMMSLDSRSKTRLDALDKSVQTNYRNMAIANGLNLPEAVTDKNAQAEAWLKANPDHPKAAEVRLKLGK